MGDQQRLLAAIDRQHAAWQRLQAVRRFPAEDSLVQLRRATAAEQELATATDAVRELLPFAC